MENKSAISDVFRYCYSILSSDQKWLDTEAEVHNYFENSSKEFVKRIDEIYGSIRILGMNNTINLKDIYVGANILKKITSREYLEIHDLMRNHRLLEESNSEDYIDKGVLERFRFRDRKLTIAQETITGIEAVNRLSKIFLIGKPGSGKTTFLKYLAFHAVNGELSEKLVPVFIEVRDVSRSENSIAEHIKSYFGFYNFPEIYIQAMLKEGKCIILIDGLDEIKKSAAQKIIKDINDFSLKYSKNRFVITCRIGAYDYYFDKFDDIEIADFSDEQIQNFVKSWYESEPEKARVFLDKLSNDIPVKELCYNPLLLTMLCWMFGDLMDFPKNRAELYREAINVLLKRWDATRLIERDEIYKGLSTIRKENMFSCIAIETFPKDEYFFQQYSIEKHISDYILNLPEIEGSDILLDSEAVLKSIESQHGIFVEKARRIYSFSHISFQEYFTAKYIIDNPTHGALEHYLHTYLVNSKWAEVFVIISGMLPNADSYLSLMNECIDAKYKDLNLNRLLKKIRVYLAKNGSIYLTSLSISVALYWIIESRIINSRTIQIPQKYHASHFSKKNEYEEEMIPGTLNIDKFYHDIVRDILYSFTFDRKRAVKFVRGLSNNSYRSSCFVQAINIHPRIRDDFINALTASNELSEEFFKCVNGKNYATNEEIVKKFKLHPDKIFNFIRNIRFNPSHALVFVRALISSPDFIYYLPHLILPPTLLEKNELNNEMNKTILDKLISYMKANRLLLKCIMSESYVSKDIRMEIIDGLFVPIHPVRKTN